MADVHTQGRVLGQGCGVSMISPGVLLSRLHVLPSPDVLSTLPSVRPRVFSGFLHRHPLTTDPTSSPSALPRHRGSGAEDSTCLNTGLVLLATSPYPLGALHKSPSLT